MKFIQLANSKKRALVDDEAYRWLHYFKWYENAHGYAVARTKDKAIYMHRVVAETPEHLITDHINGLRLDNRLENLRNSTHAQNSTNRKIVHSGRSKFRGVAWDSRSSKWRVVVQANRKRKHVGMFDNEIEAAMAYDRVARELHGEYAVLNFK